MSELLLSTIVVPMNDKKIGIQLKKARTEAGLSQEQVGQKLGLTWEMVSRYENGRSSALKHIHKLSEILKKPVNFFIEDNSAGYESFSIDTLVTKLKEEILEYTNPKLETPKVKLITNISGAGITKDAENSNFFVEAPSKLFKKFPTGLYAIEISALENESEIPDGSIGFFVDSEESVKSEMLLTFDGLCYRLERHSKKNNLKGAVVAYLVGITQFFN